MKYLLTCLLLFLALADFAQKRPALTPAQMQEDLTYLRGYLERTHPMLYMHRSREAMQYTLDSLSRTLDRPLPFLSFYQKINQLITLIGDEHSSAGYGNGFNAFLNTRKLFPFQLHFTKGRAQVLVNLTTRPDVALGDEVLSINGRPMDSIRLQLHRYIPTDGWSVPAKDQALSGLAFSVWYHLFLDSAANYQVTFRKNDGAIYSRTVAAVRMGELNKNALKNPANKEILALDERFSALRKELLRSELLPAKQAAILTVGTFGMEPARFRQRIDSCFKVIAANNVKRLVIDLSGNDGGDVELAADLLNYFITAPTSLVEYSYLLTDKDEDLKLANVPEEILKSKYDYLEPLKDGKVLTKLSKYAGELKPLQPRTDRFDGKVYLYVSGKTASAASTFAAVMKSLKLATVVGQETMGGYPGGGTVIGLELTLPNSKLKVHSGLIYQRFRTTGGDPHHGVLPDVAYAPELMQVIRDPFGWKRFILDLP